MSGATATANVKMQTPSKQSAPATAAAAPAAPAKPEVKYLVLPEIDETLTPRAGDRVFWYPQGDFGGSPVPAIVTRDGDMQRAMSLTVFHEGYMSFVMASKHMHSTATVTDRERNGGWAWNRGIKPLKKD